MEIGHEKFKLPDDHKWRQEHTLQSFNKIVNTLERTLIELRRERDDVFIPAYDDGGMATPYADWAGRIVNIIIGGHGNVSHDLAVLVSHVGEIDALLEDERRQAADDAVDLATVRRLAQDVIDHPASRVAKEKLREALDRPNG